MDGGPGAEAERVVHVAGGLRLKAAPGGSDELNNVAAGAARNRLDAGGGDRRLAAMAALIL